MENKTVGKNLIKIIKIAFIIIGILSAIFASFVSYYASKEESKTYGKCVIEYSSDKFTEIDIDKVANALKNEGVFADSKSITVFLEREDTNFTIRFTVKSTIIDNDQFQTFRDKIQTYFPENKIIIALCTDEDKIIAFREFK